MTKGFFMIKKLAKHGNSYALVFTKPLMELLDMEASTLLDVKIVDGRLVIQPVAPAKKVKTVSSDYTLQKLVEKNIKKYAPALKKLAKN